MNKINMSKQNTIYLSDIKKIKKCNLLYQTYRFYFFKTQKNILLHQKKKKNV